MKYLDKETVEQAMRDIGAGRYFSVTFVKRTTGEQRTLQGQLGVRKHLKGGVKTTDDSDVQTVYEPEQGSYKCFPLDSVLGLRFNGKEIGAIQ